MNNRGKDKRWGMRDSATNSLEVVSVAGKLHVVVEQNAALVASIIKHIRRIHSTAPACIGTVNNNIINKNQQQQQLKTVREKNG